MNVRKLEVTLSLCCSLMLAACGGSEPGPGTTEPTKAEVAQQIASGKADHGVDWCARFDWYGDGICDDFCANPDPDCGDAYDPCDGLACGDLCSLCAPGDANCVETAVIKMCQPDGSCSATASTCGDDDGGDDDGGDGGDGGGDDTYDPCEGLACGELCSLCAPGDPDCFETADIKYCQADGSCSGAAPPSTCDESYDPCAGKSCGDACTLCPPGATDCVETAVIKLCGVDGWCSEFQPVCQ